MAVKEFLVAIDSIEEPTFEASGGEISDVSGEEFDDHDVASGYRTNVDAMEENFGIVGIETTLGSDSGGEYSRSSVDQEWRYVQFTDLSR